MSSTTTLSSKVAPNSYSVNEFVKDFTIMAKSRDGAKDVLDLVVNACDWVRHLGISERVAGETSSTLGSIRQGFSLMDFFHHFGALRDQYRVSEVKDSDRLKEDIFDHSVLGVKSGAEFGIFVHNTGIYPLKEAMRSLKTVFWMALGVFDTVSLYRGMGKIKEYHTQLDQARVNENREILESKITLTYLQMVQSATTVAMVAIALVSIVFASAAHGLLFNPIVMLGLSSAWIVLQFINYFYDKIIVHRENSVLATGNLV